MDPRPQNPSSNPDPGARAVPSHVARVLRSGGRFATDAAKAARRLRRRPGYAAASIVVLGLGIGLTTAVVTVLDSVVLRGLPYRSADRLVELWTSVENGADRLPTVSARALDALRQDGGALEEVEAYVSASLVMLEGDAPERWQSARVTPGVFGMLGIPPLLGRTFDTGPDGSVDDASIILSEAVWRQRFGADHGILGRRIRFEDGTYQVIGVMPSKFAYPTRNTRAWVALATPLARAGVRGGLGLGRLRPGLTLEDAQRRLDAQSAAQREAGLFDSGEGYALEPMEHWHGATSSARTGLLILLGAVVLVLVVSCANVAALALRQATDGRMATAVRAALGAGRARLVSEQVAEGVVLGVAGAVPGAFLAQWLVRAMVGLAPVQLRLLESGRMPVVDGRIFLFVCVCAILVGVVTGAAPALFTAGTDPARMLRSAGRTTGDRRAHRAGDLLVAGQVALGLALACGAALLLNSFVRLQRVDPGYDAGRVYSIVFRLPLSRYGTAEAEVAAIRTSLDELRSIPGVTGAASARLAPPFAVMGSPSSVEADNGGKLADIGDFVPYNDVDPEYFGVLGIRMLEGRTFDAGDVARDEGIILNETMARRLWPGSSALGRQVHVGRDNALRTVIGIAADTRQIGLDDPLGNDMEYYLPQTRRRLNPYVTLLIRTDLPATPLAAAVRARFHAVDPLLPIDEITNLGDAMRGTLDGRRFMLGLVAVFALVAMIIVMVGIHAMVSWAVSRRTREIGIRLALGEPGGRVVRGVIGRTMATVGVGVGAGVFTAVALSRFLASQLYQVAPRDPSTLAAAVVAFLALSLLSSAGAATRAARIDPLDAIRNG